MFKYEYEDSVQYISVLWCCVQQTIKWGKTCCKKFKLELGPNKFLSIGPSFPCHFAAKKR